VAHRLLSSIDDYVEYKQIKMAKEDKKKKPTFVTQCRTFCYMVLLFGLINVGADYQLTAQTLFHDIMHEVVKIYLNKMIIKSKSWEGHVLVLVKFFKRLRKFNMPFPVKVHF